jgi:ElaB/YqjD/DUF883 family membrane-anchored ribosome-binding protein
MTSSIEELSENLRKLLEAAEELLRGSAAGAGKTMDQAGEHARETLHRVCGHLRNARDEVSGRARKLDGAVHAHPWPALAATAIVAFIAGLAARRR